MTATKRARPAWLSYASDWIADETYSMASARERGLLFSMLNYAWVNGSVPADPARMAKALGVELDDCKLAFDDLIRRHFQRAAHDSNRLVCPELERQRSEDAEFRRKKALAGQKGGRNAQARIRERLTDASSASSNAQAAEKNGEDEKRNALLRGPISDVSDFLSDYERAERELEIGTLEREPGSDDC